MQLKRYQERALDALRTFLDAAAIKPHEQAYREACLVGEPGAYSAAYHPLPGFQTRPTAV